MLTTKVTWQQDNLELGGYLKAHKFSQNCMGGKGNPTDMTPQSVAVLCHHN